MSHMHSHFQSFIVTAGKKTTSDEKHSDSSANERAQNGITNESVKQQQVILYTLLINLLNNVCLFLSRLSVCLSVCMVRPGCINVRRPRNMSREYVIVITLN